MQLNEWIKIIGSVCGTCGMIVLYFVFMAAYFIDSKTTCIDIDNYGEASTEVIVVHLQLILSVVGTALMVLTRDRKKPKSDENKIPSRNLASV
jgi:hypothetical protein